MSDSFFDNCVIVAALFAVAWLIGRYSPAENYDAVDYGPDEAEDWSLCYPKGPPTVPFKSLRVGQQFTIPASNDPDLIFEKIRPAADGSNARSDVYDRFIIPLMHVYPVSIPVWRTP